MQKKDSSLNVPVDMIVYALYYNLTKALMLFWIMKLIFPGGKFKMDASNIWVIMLCANIKSRKSFNKYVRDLYNQDWIRTNKKTNYVILKSFDVIRKENDWKNKLAFPVTFENCLKIDAIIGAVIYGNLYRNFRWKLKRNRSVRVKERTYHSYLLKSEKFMAPIAVAAVSKLFNISVGKAHTLKRKAEDANLIDVKNYLYLIEDQSFVEFKKEYYKLRRDYVIKKGKYYKQQITLIYPNFHFCKRKTLKHIQRV